MNKGMIGSFTIQDGQITSGMKDYGGMMALEPTGGLSFMVSGVRHAKFGPNIFPPESSANGLLSLTDADTKGGYSIRTLMHLFIGQSTFASHPQVWIDCKHLNGWGSGFTVESRYLGDGNSMERTCIKIGQMASCDKLVAHGVTDSNEAKWHPLFWHEDGHVGWR